MKTIKFLGLACGLAAILVSLVPSRFLTPAQAKVEKAQTQRRSQIHGITATHSDNGVLLYWHFDFNEENLGFNVFRISKDGRVKLNRDIIPGSVFITPRQASLQRTNTFAFLDEEGHLNSTYVIESVTVEGKVEETEAIRPTAGPSLEDVKRRALKSSGHRPRAAEQTEYAAGSKVDPVGPPSGPIEDQWSVVSQPALKIAIKNNGWYRVTHEQMTGAGFNPTVDIRNVRLYVDGREIGIRTSKGSGTFAPGDYFEFFGRGLDTPTADSRTHYLIAGTERGKRIPGDFRINHEPSLPLNSTPSVPNLFGPIPGWTMFPFVLKFLYGFESSVEKSETPKPAVTTPEPAPSPSAEPKEGATTKKTRKAVKKKLRRHAHATANSAVQSFAYTVERKDRRVYFLNVLNGDKENYFGDVIVSSPVTQTLNLPNPEPTAVGPAKLEVALQGVGGTPHQIDISVNDAIVGTMNFVGLEHLISVFDVPISLLNNGANAVKFTSVAGGVCIVDYVRMTYPHALTADNNSLRLGLRSALSVTISGFSTSNLRLLDHTDPYNVTLTTPFVEPSGGGFAAKVESSQSRSKSRLLITFPEGQFNTPASFSLNQPSSLNASSNGADLLIIAHRSLVPSIAPLVALRQSQGLVVSVVEVEDVFDEFSFGEHGPQAIKSFLSHAASTWSRPPRYVLLLGDGSHDPRNYEGRGDFDLVPTKLIGATFNETSSDDWLSDFNDDGLPEIPIGRLPVRTTAEASLLVAKIVNFSPPAVPQSALLVADDPTDYHFNFETANDEVQTLLPSSMAVERINRRTDPNARQNLINKFNSGQALVNYTGHGNIDTWTGAQIFTSGDAARLFNAVSIVISQVYGGGGEAGSTYRNDFVELFNRGAWPVNLSGWSVQYASATGSSWSVTNLPNVVVPPGKYFLVQLAQGPGGTTNLPTPDVVGTTNLSESDGKVALVNSTSALSGSGCPIGLGVVDFVGYGSADCARGAAAPALTATTASVRGNNGCTNTNVNSGDFSGSAPTPRNSTSSQNACPNASSRLPLSFVVVMDCLNGYFQDPVLQGLAEVLVKAPNGGGVAAFASSGLTLPEGQHVMARQLYILLYGPQSIALGDAIKTAKAATTDVDVRRTWILLGDPSMRIR